MNTYKKVMLVEDDQIDVMLTQKVFNANKIDNELVIVENGERAIDYLEHNPNQLPGLIFLDLNMPRMSGIEFLEIIKSNDSFKNIPVIVLTTSKNESDIDKCFKLGVAGYIAKPVIYNDFIEAIRVVKQYWSLSQLP
ncbi:MAG TPA: two-component system response regulator [Bacteroidales bacterium]|nr:two-component system response regulator [Bacteroidales bacterium]